MWNEIVRIKTRPGLKCLDGLVHFSCYIAVILFGDVKTLTFAHPVAQIVGFMNPFLGGLELLLIYIMDSDSCVAIAKF